MDYTYRILCKDVLEGLASLPDESVQCCVTSPPYWGLRDYGVEGQIGLEDTFEEWLQKMVVVFIEVQRVLKDNGVLWVNIGDGYAWQGIMSEQGESGQRAGRTFTPSGIKKRLSGDLKPKDMIGQPWSLAFALRDLGYYLRSDIIWNKPNCMPEKVDDRPTKSHEYIFLFSKSLRYFYDAEAIKETSTGMSNGNRLRKSRKGAGGNPNYHGDIAYSFPYKANGTRNIRSVWKINTQRTDFNHFATFPEEIPKRCILAGSAIGDTILDPFSGTGTTGKVALELNRNYIGIELNQEYADYSIERLNRVSRQTRLAF